MTITIALPSKGRMKDEASGYLRARRRASSPSAATAPIAAEWKAGRVSRSLLVSLPEISREIGNGTVDFGVTGEDLVREGLAEADRRVEIAPGSVSAAPMWWSRCREIWLDVGTRPTLAMLLPIFAPVTVGG